MKVSWHPHPWFEPNTRQIPDRHVHWFCILLCGFTNDKELLQASKNKPLTINEIFVSCLTSTLRQQQTRETRKGCQKSKQNNFAGKTNKKPEFCSEKLVIVPKCKVLWERIQRQLAWWSLSVCLCYRILDYGGHTHILGRDEGRVDEGVEHLGNSWAIYLNVSSWDFLSFKVCY